MSRVFFAWALACAVFYAFSPLSSAVLAAPSDEPPAIVLAFFGSSDAATQKHVESFAAAVRKEYPQHKVVLAYTSQRGRAALRQRDTDAPSVTEALSRLPDQGVRRAVVQSMHVMPGYEFQDILAVAAALRGLPKGLYDIRVGAPLLANAQTLEKVAVALLESVPNRDRQDAVLFVGHGTDHTGGLAYPALQYTLSERDPLAFVAVLGDGKFSGTSVPSDASVLQKIQKTATKRVFLVPLLTVAGVHMKDDIMGKENDSWSSRLRAAGLEVVEVRQGLLEALAIQKIYLERIAAGLGK